jgi:transcriptional regulator with XRE-family HTH domain
MATVRAWREASGMTAEQLASEVGVPAGVVAAWEEGRAAPETHQVGQLALALGVTPEELRAAVSVSQAEGEAGQDAATQEIMDRS